MDREDQTAVQVKSMKGKGSVSGAICTKGLGAGLKAVRGPSACGHLSEGLGHRHLEDCYWLMDNLTGKQIGSTEEVTASGIFWIGEPFIDELQLDSV